MGIGIKECLHYTLHDLAIEITYRNEKQSKEAWLIGARVLEAIGCSFSKNNKYSKEPHIYTKKEMEGNERKAFYDFVNRWAK